MTRRPDWAGRAAALVNDWDAVQGWSDPQARQVQQADAGRRAVELLRQAVADVPARVNA